MQAPQDTKPRWERRKDARPQELLAAALEQFVERGYAATRLEDVAKRAGVSKGTLYLYYPSKEELLKAVIQQNYSGLIAEGAGIVDNFDGPTAELLGMLMRMWWKRVGSSPAGGIHKIIMAEVRNFPEIAEFYSQEVVVPAHDLVSGIVERGIERGEFRPVPPHEVTHVLIAPLIFLALHQHTFGECPIGEHPVEPSRLIETQIDLVLHGLLQTRPSEKA